MRNKDRWPHPSHLSNLSNTKLDLSLSLFMVVSQVNRFQTRQNIFCLLFGKHLIEINNCQQNADKQLSNRKKRYSRPGTHMQPSFSDNQFIFILHVCWDQLDSSACNTFINLLKTCYFVISGLMQIYIAPFQELLPICAFIQWYIHSTHWYTCTCQTSRNATYSLKNSLY